MHGRTCETGKHYMLNNISGYGWVFKQFKHQFSMDLNEVNAYRMDIPTPYAQCNKSKYFDQFI